VFGIYINLATVIFCSDSLLRTWDVCGSSAWDSAIMLPHGKIYFASLFLNKIHVYYALWTEIENTGVITFHGVKRVEFVTPEKEAKNSTDPTIFLLSLTFISVYGILVTFQKKTNLMDGSTFSKVNTEVQHRQHQRHWAVSSTSHNPIRHSNISLPAFYRPLTPLIWKRKGRTPEFCMHFLSPHQTYTHRLS
jgi:hypothetical protein